MANFFKDNADILYYFDKGTDWASLIEATEFGYRTTDGIKSAEEGLELYRDIASMVGELAAMEIAPNAAAIDREGVHFTDGEVQFPPRLQGLFDQMKALDLHGLNVPRELGGMNAPLLLYFINAELLARADVSVMSHHGFHGGMAMAMLALSIFEGTTRFDAITAEIKETRFADAIREIARGDAWGCMDITEPDAGSDMAKLSSIGEQDETGAWFVTGQKIFITSGHGKYHFVIARTEMAKEGSDATAGLDGLSMFLVPTYEEDDSGKRHRIVALDRIEEKLGHHGSATCALSFDRAPAHLVGKRGEGFKYMLMLMNNARLGVGFECLGLMEAAYEAARSYAEERPSMGKAIADHEMIADYLDEMRTDIQGLRSIAMAGAFHEEMAMKLKIAALFATSQEEAERLDGISRRHTTRARRVTPLIKYYGAEKAVEHARRALQIHGGNGYTRDYAPEKLLRDALVMPIYEGTSQIQALMAMKDTLGTIIKSPKDFVRRRAQARWRAVSSRDALERRVAKLEDHALSAQQHLMARTAGDKFRSLKDTAMTEWPRRFLRNWDPKRDFAFAMLHAERLTRLLSDQAICEALLEQAKAHPERREVLERYLVRAEPRVRFLHDEITTTGDLLLGRRDRGEAVADAAE